MDGSRQKSKAAMRAIVKIGAKVLNVPAHSPDLNPIEIFLTLRL